MEFKREKITDMERIKALYKEGKISRTTFWRAKKRGYIFDIWTEKTLGLAK